MFRVMAYLRIALRSGAGWTCPGIQLNFATNPRAVILSDDRGSPAPRASLRDKTNKAVHEIYRYQGLRRHR
jgi:hypothetical protein